MNAKCPSAFVTVVAESLPASLMEIVTPLTPLPLPSLSVPATQPRAGSTVHCGTATMRALCTIVFVGDGVGLGVAADAGAPRASTTPAAEGAIAEESEGWGAARGGRWSARVLLVVDGTRTGARQTMLPGPACSVDQPLTEFRNFDGALPTYW